MIWCGVPGPGLWPGPAEFGDAVVTCVVMVFGDAVVTCVVTVFGDAVVTCMVTVFGDAMVTCVVMVFGDAVVTCGSAPSCLSLGAQPETAAAVTVAVFHGCRRWHRALPGAAAEPRGSRAVSVHVCGGLSGGFFTCSKKGQGEKRWGSRGLLVAAGAVASAALSGLSAFSSPTAPSAQPVALFAPSVCLSVRRASAAVEAQLRAQEKVCVGAALQRFSAGPVCGGGLGVPRWSHRGHLSLRCPGHHLLPAILAAPSDRSKVTSWTRRQLLGFEGNQPALALGGHAVGTKLP